MSPLSRSFKVAFSDGYRYEQESHPVFPIGKNIALHELLTQEGLTSPERVIAPPIADWSLLSLVHDERYLDRLNRVALSAAEIRRFGFPLNAHIVRRARFTVQGTLQAAYQALDCGFAGNLAGGSHHARPDAAAGYCLLNDVAVAARALLTQERVERPLIIDLDVHQGDGTALIFQNDPAVFTVSVHAEQNFPSRKVPSDLDLPLPDQTQDDEYLDRMVEAIDPLLTRLAPDVILYNAGVDVVEGDRLGRLALTPLGLQLRDRWILTAAQQRRIPIVAVLGGGYRETALATADLHATVYREAHRVFAAGV